MFSPPAGEREWTNEIDCMSTMRERGGVVVCCMIDILLGREREEFFDEMDLIYTN